MRLLELFNISFSYENNINILENLHLELYENQKIGIFGNTGCGKSTLLYIIMGLLKPDCGEITVFGKKIIDIDQYSEIRPKIGFMFQNSDDQLFSPTVIDDIAFGPLNLGKSKEDALNISETLLKELDIERLKYRITHKLSGGEKKLVALATILAMKPKFLLLDEPLVGLDPDIRSKIKRLLIEMNVSIITISHDHNFLDEISQKTYSFSQGKLISGK